MLKVVYSEKGQAVSDFEVNNFVRDVVTEYNFGNDKTKVIEVSTENVFKMFELKTLQGKLGMNDIEFYYEDIKLDFSKYKGVSVPKEFEDEVSIGIAGHLGVECLRACYNNGMRIG